MKIIDDFLSDHEWKRVEKAMTSVNFPWSISDIVYPDEMECDQLDNFQMIHCFYDATGTMTVSYTHLTLPTIYSV